MLLDVVILFDEPTFTGFRLLDLLLHLLESLACGSLGGLVIDPVTPGSPLVKLLVVLLTLLGDHFLTGSYLVFRFLELIFDLAG